MGNHVGAQTEPPPLFEAEIDAEPMLPAPDEVVFRMRQAILDGDHWFEALLDALAPVHAAFWGKVDQPVMSFVPHVDGDMQTDAMTAGSAAGPNP